MNDLKITIWRVSGLFIFLFALISCEKEIQLDIGDFQPQIVVNALFKSGENWEVHVCKSKNVLNSDPASSSLHDAKVFIENIDSGKIIELVHAGDGLYLNNDHVVQHGVDYKITVSHLGFEKVTAVASVPHPIEVKVLDSQTFDFHGKLALQVDFEINDDPDSDNYYIYEILNLFPDAPMDPAEVPFLESPIKSWLSSVDGNTGYIHDATEKQSKLFITDQNFRGSILNASLVSFVEVQENGLNGEPGTIDELQYTPDFSKSRLKVIGASIEMYEYYKSIELMIQREALNSSASTPIKPYSNIQNGLGVFAGFTELVVNVKE